MNTLRLRKEFIDRFGKLKDFIQSLVDQRNSLVSKNVYSKASEAKGQLASRGFNQLTKNALQNVVQYFQPWGRDFIVLRLVNRKIKAAYTDHLKSIVNIGNYLQTIQSQAKQNSSDQLEHLFKYIGHGKIYEKDGKDWQGNDVGPKFLIESKERDFVQQLVMNP